MAYPYVDIICAKAGFVYYMVCSDMPHLMKIGRTVSARHRLREANSHDTFKPPSGFVYGEVVRVEDMGETENGLHTKFAHCRVKNSQGNSSEFFKMEEEEVRAAFAELIGEREDLSKLSQTAESEETARVRELLRSAVETCEPCLYVQPNPKHAGTKCHARYELYKSAVTMDDALALGTFEDLVYDYDAGFLTLVPEIPPPSEWL